MLTQTGVISLPSILTPIQTLNPIYITSNRQPRKIALHLFLTCPSASFSPVTPTMVKTPNTLVVFGQKFANRLLRASEIDHILFKYSGPDEETFYIGHGRRYLQKNMPQNFVDRVTSSLPIDSTAWISYVSRRVPIVGNLTTPSSNPTGTKYIGKNDIRNKCTSRALTWVCDI
jgi:hypothetical protein